MREEKTQELIEYCEEVQGNNPESSVAYKAISVALAALTAQPVKKPQTHDVHGFPEPAHVINNRWIEAIREAGYEVQE